MIYNISDEPTYGFKRKVEVGSIEIQIEDISGQCVNLKLIVRYYENDGVTPMRLIPFKWVTLRADNTTWVDVDGNIVPEGDIAAVMTEYEFFMIMMEVPVVISDIVEAKVAWADSLGRFN